MSAPQLDGTLGKNRAHFLAKSASAIERVEKTLFESCHPKQRDFAWDPARRVAATCPRGAGKTTGVLAKLTRIAHGSPGSQNLFIATSRPQGEVLLWQPLKELFDSLQIRAKFNESKLKATLLDNGATIFIVGMDDKREVEKLRGVSWRCTIVDEAGSHKPKLLENLVHRIVGPRLGTHGNLTLIGTPSGEYLSGIFYDATRPGGPIARPYSERMDPEYKNWIRWSSHHWNLEDGAPHVPAINDLLREALIEKEANGWSDDNPVWRREYLGEWAADDTERMFKYRPHDEEGKPLNQWDPKRDKNGFAVLPKGHDWRFVFGMDMGHSDPFALVVLAYSLTDRSLYHIYEFSKKEMHTTPIANLLLGEDGTADKPQGVIGALGWPDAMVADTAGLGGGYLKELSDVHGIRAEPAKKRDKHDAIELTNGDFLDGRLFILKGSKLEEQLTHLQWDTNEYGELREPKGERNDLADALIYGRKVAHHMFSEEAAPVITKTLEQRIHEKEDELAEEPNEFEQHLSNDDEYQDYDDFFG